MNITVKTTRLDAPSNNIVGLATVNFGDNLKIRGIKVIEGQNGFFVGMPSYKSKEMTAEGKSVYKNVVSITNSDFEEKLKVATLQSFESGEELTIQSIEGKDAPSVNANVTVLESAGNTKALARLNVEDMVEINNVAVREAGNGNNFVSMPSYKSNQLDESGNPVYKNYCYGANKEFQSTINDAVLGKYSESLNRNNKSKDKPSLNDKLAEGENKKKLNVKETVQKSKSKSQQIG